LLFFLPNSCNVILCNYRIYLSSFSILDVVAVRHENVDKTLTLRQVPGTNIRGGSRPNYLGASPSLSLPSLPLLFPFLSLTFSPSLLVFPLFLLPPLSRPSYIQLGSLGERCKLPQRGLGGAPTEVEFCAF